MSCAVSCGSTSFPWLIFFFGIPLWGSMIHKHTGRWMWQWSASVISWRWEKYSCQSRLVTSRLSAPWITEEAREARRQRRKAEKKWRATRLEVHRQLFVKSCNEVKTLFRAAKKDYYCSRLTDCTYGRQLYSLTNELWVRKKSLVYLIISLLVIYQIPFALFFCDKILKNSRWTGHV